MPITDILQDAELFLGSTDPNSQTTAQRTLNATGNLLTYPQPTTTHQLVCIDGAVASHQTDALVWIAAAAATSAEHQAITDAAVTPVGPSAERLRGAVMALTEMKMAVEASHSHEHVWMDGGLVTPLISVATALTDTNEAASTSLVKTLNRSNAHHIIANYVDLAIQGRLKALPKQDTARAFVQHWATSPNVTPELHDWFLSRSDRSCVSLLLDRGQRTRTRSAVEALKVEIKKLSAMSIPAQKWINVLNQHYSRWREEVSAHIAYVMPRNGIGRAIKIELTCTNPHNAENDMDVAASIIDSHIVGPHIIEPLPQHLVDLTAKKAVSSAIIDLMSAVDMKFSTTHPEAANQYRS